MTDLFGKYCYIDTPWIAGKKTRYRIIKSGVRSNAWCEVPVTGRTELIRHDNMEEIVFVVLDTMVSDASIIRRFALKDVDVIPADVRPVIDGNWIPVTNGRGGHECSKCHQYAPSYQRGSEYLSRFCPACGCYMGED